MPRRSLLIAPVLALLLLTTGCVRGSARVSPPPAECKELTGQDSAMVTWLSKQAVRLRSVEPGPDRKDLQPLKANLNGVQLIGLGEATHGTREFSTAKHRLMQFLAQQMGVRTMLFEMNYDALLPVEEYIQGGEGDVRNAMRRVYEIWHTEEVAAMVEWMRSYNLSVPPDQRIHAVGIDMQSALVSAHELAQYLEKEAPAFYPRVAKPLEFVKTTTDTSNSMPFATATIQRLTDLRSIGTYLTEPEQELVAASSRQAFQKALLEAHIVARNYELEFASLKSDIPYLRDKLMADTAVEVVGQVGPAALWAHNSHITTDAGAMGRYLRNALGDKYYAIDLLTGEGELTARALKRDGTNGPLRTYTLPAVATGQLEWYFACAGLGNSYVNLRDSHLPADVAAWVNQSRSTWAIGWAYPENNQFALVNRVWPNSLDGMLYIPVTTASRPLSAP